MRTTHDGSARREFDALAGHLVATFDQFGVGEAEKAELLGMRVPCGSLVEVDRSTPPSPTAAIGHR